MFSVGYFCITVYFSNDLFLPFVACDCCFVNDALTSQCIMMRTCTIDNEQNV